MNIYKVPNLIISPSVPGIQKKGDEGAMNDESIHTHTLIHTHTENPTVRKRRPLGLEKDASLEQI